jgi:predicted AlkP superfamily phosphohydrolase/phosphomutase
MPEAPKVLIIGLDGATFKIIKPLAELGRLPNISRLIGRGSSASLRASTPPITPVCWSSFLTGNNPGKHGIFDFVRMREGTYALEFVNGGYRKSETIWKCLNKSGYTVGVLNVPFTYPPEKVDGYMIAGMDAPAVDRRAAHPQEIFDEIVEEMGRYSLWSFGKRGDALRKELNTLVDDTTRISEYLIETHPTDVFMVVYGATDEAQHFCFTDDVASAYSEGDEQSLSDDVIAEIYSRVDEGVGRLVDRMDPETMVILMSDHGATPIKKLFYLDRWLAQAGYLVYKQEGNRKGARRLLGGILKLAKTVLSQYLPRSMQDRIVQSVFFPRIRAMRRGLESRMTFSNVDWSKTRACPLGRSGGIRINLQGRDPEGIVAPDDYARTREEIAGALMRLRDEEDDSQVVADVSAREELYEGEALTDAPDMILTTTDCRYMVRQSDGSDGPILQSKLGAGWGPFNIPGTHDMDGILILSSEKIRHGVSIANARLEDVAPTMLYLLGAPIPEEMDGLVLSAAIENDYLDTHEVKYRETGTAASAAEQATYSPDEEEVIRQRLKGLGYME